MKNIRHVHSGFLGHENDAGTYQQIGSIGAGWHLYFPADCFLLANDIYPNEHPLVTAYTSLQKLFEDNRVINVDAETLICFRDKGV